VPLRVPGRGEGEEPQLQTHFSQGLPRPVVAAILCHLPTLQAQGLARSCCGQLQPPPKPGTRRRRV